MLWRGEAEGGSGARPEATENVGKSEGAVDHLNEDRVLEALCDGLQCHSAPKSVGTQALRQEIGASKTRCWLQHVGMVGEVQWRLREREVVEYEDRKDGMRRCIYSTCKKYE